MIVIEDTTSSKKSRIVAFAMLALVSFSLLSSEWRSITQSDIVYGTDTELHTLGGSDGPALGMRQSTHEELQQLKHLTLRERLLTDGSATPVSHMARASVFCPRLAVIGFALDAGSVTISRIKDSPQLPIPPPLSFV